MILKILTKRGDDDEEIFLVVEKLKKNVNMHKRWGSERKFN